MIMRLGPFVCALYLVALNICSSVDSTKIGQLTFCDPSKPDNPRQSLVYISTLDGKITALNLAANGEKLWAVGLSNEPLLASNIHQAELTSNGRWVKLIPSLKGSLYKFDGENLESVPVTSDQLLRSSFRYSDDLIFSGGKETRSYGISSHSGKIVYECSIRGCINTTDSEKFTEEEIVIVQHYQQTIRAIDPRIGSERWNYSVGHHELSQLHQKNRDCSNAYPSNLLDIDIRVIVPEGLVWGVNRSNPLVKLWEYKFDSPIVSVWREQSDPGSPLNMELKEVNLFNNTQWTSDSAGSPSIYMGMHKRQLYIQENPAVKTMEHSSMPSLDYAQYPWQPYPAIAFKERTGQMKIGKELSLEFSESRTTAVSVLYNSEYINGNGFYLFSKNQLDISNNRQCNRTPIKVLREEEVLKEETVLEYFISRFGELGEYWGEVTIISLLTTILLNCLFMPKWVQTRLPKFFRMCTTWIHMTYTFMKTKTPILPVVMPVIVERYMTSPEEKRKVSVGEDENFSSRYLNDFEPIDCLGKGGYGIVFEARNKIDECIYAIKRISLSNNHDSRARVIREVKALAKLDHQNIVRYFNAWLECPPSGWQEEQDRLWLKTHKIPESDFMFEISPSDSKLDNDVCIDVNSLSLDSAREAYLLDEPEDICEDNEDSFIVFAQPNHNGELSNGLSSREMNTEKSQLSEPLKSIEKKNDDYSESIVFEHSGEKKEVEDDEEEEEDDEKRVKNAKAVGIWKSPKMYLYIQMQLCQRRSLQDWLKHHSVPRHTANVVTIFQQIVDAVEYVHLNGLIHRDLKPSNIFFAYDDKVKIGDFGLVTAMAEGCKELSTLDGTPSELCQATCGIHTSCVGTHLYMSPEQMNGKLYNYKVDIYSLGIILFELLTPFKTEMERVAALTNLKNSVLPEDFSTSFPAEYELLKMMLDEDPTKRPTTLGIQARPPLLNYHSSSVTNENQDIKWHFELPQISRHSSSSKSESLDNCS